jgi:DNA adenine methylase
MKAPFPYFGGKSRVADIVWERFGHVRNYIEPFAGSLAVLLERPLPFKGIEIVNDADGLLTNFWRSMCEKPDDVVRYADQPVNEAELHAKHLWLVRNRNTITEKLMADPHWCDPLAAGWWVWGISAWIGDGWCSGEGPWTEIDGVFVKTNLKNGVHRKLPCISPKGTNRPTGIQCLQAVKDRVKKVRVICGDWGRAVTNSAMVFDGSTPCGIFLDPPYSTSAGWCGDIYAVNNDVASDVRRWCILNGSREELRIALCGYEGEHEELEKHGWTVFSWKTKGGYGSQSDGKGRDNSERERIWFSPHCLNSPQIKLF